MTLVLVIVGTEMYLARFPPDIVNRLEEKGDYQDLLKVNQWRQFATDYTEIKEGQTVDLPLGKYFTVWEI